MSTDGKTVNINELINELQKQGIEINVEHAAIILDFLYLAAAILIGKEGNENS